jgi:phage shock protein A
MLTRCPSQDRLEELAREAMAVACALVSEQYALVSETATESLLEVVEDRLASLDARLLALEDRMSRLPDLERANSRSAETAAGCAQRGSSVWNRLVHLFQRGTNGKSQE